MVPSAILLTAVVRAQEDGKDFIAIYLALKALTALVVNKNAKYSTSWRATNFFSLFFLTVFFFSFLGLEIIIGSMRHVVSVVIKPFAIPFRVPAHANPVGTDPCKTHTIIKMAMRQRISSLPFLIFLFSIQRCDDPCPDGTHGQNCASNCRCQNDGTCNPIDGNCFCKDGWTVSAFYIGNKKKNLYNMWHH